MTEAFPRIENYRNFACASPRPTLDELHEPNDADKVNNVTVYNSSPSKANGDCCSETTKTERLKLKISLLATNSDGSKAFSFETC